MPDIREVLKGLSPDDRAIYTEVRTAMRRAYLAAHAAKLPIDKYNETDDAFLDLIDIKIIMLFDRAGVFDHSKGIIEAGDAKATETSVHVEAQSAATRLMQEPLANPIANGKTGWQ